MLKDAAVQLADGVVQGDELRCLTWVREKDGKSTGRGNWSAKIVDKWANHTFDPNHFREANHEKYC